MNYRIEKDTAGEIRVPAERLWGAQTQRSLENFTIGTERMPQEVVMALVLLKKAAAVVNHAFGTLDRVRKEAIVTACDELLAGKFPDEFPLLVWQTGSGTQSNMNVNEVLARRAMQLIDEPVHPNDHVNLSQSSNDIFPSAMHIAALSAGETALLPSLKRLEVSLQNKVEEFRDILKIGRTHLQDATPLTLGQEFSGYAAMLHTNARQLQDALDYVRELAVGGTAVGTGLNAPPGFAEAMVEKVSELTGQRFLTASNTFQGLSSHDALAGVSGALKALAANMMKIANDVRWLGSGPRCGIGELLLPANEPGSSIMPGKVNPTQAEAVTMVACQVFGNDVAVGFAASQGNFELNTFKPVIIYNVLQSIRLLGDSMNSFRERCVNGIRANRPLIAEYLQKSLMLVTALAPHLGYETAARIAKSAHENGTTLREAAVSLGCVSEEEFDRVVRPEKMIAPA
ncbi:fumarate hydratase, class II [candidate division KSB3 bacterium]|uniref:Fumarate hydratase class II n=1 Tax=candidate division KSB3 bacterium TaxID=2044937 RepID=A0A2G6EE62_9BACT|nr:MAG: fumarate hydratase, class II [candidate division KSB3 bacterium]PIE28402.1 MAG: fumarate hydratase, class II [candidate division KSB3 bacterium]